MTDAEKETLEQLMHYMERKSATKDAAAIRSLLAELKATREALEGADPLGTERRKLKAEVERLRAEIETHLSDKEKLREAWKVPVARIEAALALAEYVVDLSDDAARMATDPRAHVAIGRAAERVAKALKGENP